MAVPRWRKLKKGAEYDVTARVNREENIFKKRQFKELFLKVVKEAKKKYKFSMKNFCIMGNNVHMIIKPLQEESLSRIMQWILSVFAVRFNKMMNYVGHVWRARFQSKIIDNIKQLINTFRNITEAPVDDGLVKNAIDYELNGICFIKRRDFTILEEPEGELASLVKRYIN